MYESSSVQLSSYKPLEPGKQISSNKISTITKKTGLETAALNKALSINEEDINETTFNTLRQYTETHSLFTPLSNEEVKEKRIAFGPNTINISPPPRWWRTLYHACIHPFNIILFLLAIVSAVMEYLHSVTEPEKLMEITTARNISTTTEQVEAESEEADYTTTVIMLVIVFISIALRFVQEWRSENAADALKELIKVRVRVIRRDPINKSYENGDIETGMRDDRGFVLEIPFAEVVPDDIVKLSAGDRVPGDIQLLSSKDLFISQSSLTGESMPVEKSVKMIPTIIPNGKLHALMEEQDICFMGTNVISGIGLARVLRTGKMTVFGDLAKELAKARPKNAFEKGIVRISIMFLVIMAIMVPIVLILNGLLDKSIKDLKHKWIEAVFFSLSVAVGLTPEMLPMIVNANIARGALYMSKRKCIVKRLDSIVNLGAMDILCTDKTGTLTLDRVTLVQHLDPNGIEALFPLQLAYVNATYQSGLINLLDKAIIDYAIDKHLNESIGQFEKLDEIPFDFSRRRVSVFVKHNVTGKLILICKGATEEILQNCTHFCCDAQHQLFDNGENSKMIEHIESINDEKRDTIKTFLENFSKDGFRMLAVAYKLINSKFSVGISAQQESNMTLVGFIGFLDPVKESAASAIKHLIEHGVTVKVLTGDNPIICRKVCEDIGLPVTSIVTSVDIKGLSQEQLAEVASAGTVFAKLDPMQKADIIEALKSRDKIVGFLGDGINDLLALHKADVGLSVDSGADAAKETADIILLEKSLMVICEGVVRGRITYANTLKYINMAVSSNFGNVFSVLVASAWLPFLPMQPIHLLVQNLLYDISQIAIPWDNVDKDFIMVPHRWYARGIIKFMLCIGPISSIFDIALFLVMWFYFDANTKAHAPLFQTGWFVVGLLTQSLIVHMIRSNKIPFIQSTASPPLLIATVLIMAIGVAIPFIPWLNNYLQMVELEPIYFAFLVSILITYCILTQITKILYIKIFKTWM